MGAGLAALCVTALGCAQLRPPEGGATDPWIREQVERVVEREAPPAVDVQVEARDGVVYLSGIVPSIEVVERLLAESARIPGVRQIVNHLRVAERPGQDAAVGARRVPRAPPDRGGLRACGPRLRLAERATAISLLRGA